MGQGLLVRLSESVGLPAPTGTIEASKPDLGEALGCVSVAENSCYVVDGKHSTDSKNK